MRLVNKFLNHSRVLPDDVIVWELSYRFALFPVLVGLLILEAESLGIVWRSLGTFTRTTRRGQDEFCELFVMLPYLSGLFVIKVLLAVLTVSECNLGVEQGHKFH